jgi:hypothetical protein
MKEVLLKIDDSAYEKFLNFITLCPMVEVVSTNVIAETKGVVDKCFAEAISVLRRDKVFRTKGDYGYIMLAVNEGALKGLFFYSPADFINYLKELGFDQLPVISTLYNINNKVSGRYPNLEYTDHPDSKERLRRNNIVARFLSAFNRAKRSHLEGILENRS